MKCAIVDERIPEGMAARLSDDGFKVIPLRRSEKLGAGVFSHTDLLLFRHKTTLIGSREYFERNADILSRIKSLLPSFDIILSDDIHGEKYPYDAIFCAKCVNDKIFYKEDTVSAAIKKYAEKAGLYPYRVKQGYTACLTLAFGDCVFTSDRGLAAAMTDAGLRVHTVEESDAIRLLPFNCGFIGGACGVYQKRIYFLGNAKCLPYYELIEKEAKAQEYEIVSLDESFDHLIDLGGMILADSF